jgi:hypothetical protein
MATDSAAIETSAPEVAAVPVGDPSILGLPSFVVGAVALSLATIGYVPPAAVGPPGPNGHLVPVQVRPEQAVRLVMLPTDQPLDLFALRGYGGHGQLPSVASLHSGIAPTRHHPRLVQSHLARPLHQQEDGLARPECKAVQVHVAVRAIRVGGQPGSPAVAARRAGAGHRDGAEVHRGQQPVD